MFSQMTIAYALLSITVGYIVDADPRLIAHQIVGFGSAAFTFWLASKL